MKLKIMTVALLVVFLAGIDSGQDRDEMTVHTQKLRETLKDIVTISVGLSGYVTDFGVAPQDGMHRIKEIQRFENTLSPFYLRAVPGRDQWGYAFLVYTGTDCNGVYGISGCGADDFVIVSLGRDGMKEDWSFDRNDPRAGLFTLNDLSDFDSDLICWNGTFVRAPVINGVSR